MKEVKIKFSYTAKVENERDIDDFINAILLEHRKGDIQFRYEGYEGVKNE